MTTAKHAAPDGKWITDNFGLPAWQPNLALPALDCHYFSSTGALKQQLDLQGRLEMSAITKNGTLVLNRLGPESAGAIYFRLSTASDSCNLFLDDHTNVDNAFMTWHVWGAEWGGTVTLSGTPVEFGISLTCPWNEPYAAIVLSLQNQGRAEFAVDVEAASDLSPRPRAADTTAPAASQPFCKNGVAIMPDAIPAVVGDYFLATPDDWQSDFCLNTLILSQKLTLAPDQRLETLFLIGFRPDCSLAWLREQFAAWNRQAVCEQWATRLKTGMLRPPQSWMGQECQWALGRILAFRAPSTRLPDAPLILQSAFAPNGATDANQLREQLQLTFAATEFDPALALQTLLDVSVRQARQGRVTTDELRQPEFTPARDAADLEVWFLAAWCHYLRQVDGLNLLDLPIAYADSATPSPLWQHLMRAVDWISAAVGTGTHDLLHWGRNDANPMLDRAGIGGKGESLLNSAIFTYALHGLAEFARQRGEDNATQERLLSLHQFHARAVGAAFDQQWFPRGYTDAGRMIGGIADNRLHLDVQAWAVLARCGTSGQREQALCQALAQCPPAPAPQCISRPYPLPPPADISSYRFPTGRSLNAGISPTINAWFVWALASDGRNEDALGIWQSGTIRQLATAQGRTPNGHGDLFDALPARLTDACAYGPVNTIQPAIFAWQQFALHKILRGG